MMGKQEKKIIKFSILNNENIFLLKDHLNKKTFQILRYISSTLHIMRL